MHRLQGDMKFEKIGFENQEYTGKYAVAKHGRIVAGATLVLQNPDLSPWKMKSVITTTDVYKSVSASLHSSMIIID